jgi:hypothetical protein
LYLLALISTFGQIAVDTRDLAFLDSGFLVKTGASVDAAHFCTSPKNPESRANAEAG